MEIYLGADHRGLELKNALGDWLKGQGHQVIDMGASRRDEEDDYPDFAFEAAHAVAEDPENRRGIGVCGTGVGMAVVANKMQGVRAGLLHDAAMAKAARNDDDVNFLALGADYISLQDAQKVVEVWLATPFSGEERHVRRLKKIERYDQSSLFT
jgi:ribose 5-phosphate isomerase B